ncbi:MAG: L-arabinose 1-dehydrogenase (NAD(P)(+)) [Candidatus Woesearchaeota archaeon]|nr:L-arabinose 1-dehydrogenase (NAD(P)(+)) [Candidatus Woesearchaeota archaeon]
MTILVTGGAGFIGSHVCEKLLKKRKKVICIDNFNDYYSPSVKENNVKNCLKSEYFELVYGDIRKKDLLSDLFNRFDINKIVHLAAMAGVRNSILKPKLYCDVNINGTLNLLELAKKNNIGNFVFGSSSSVYGDSREIPFTENKIGKPISPYAATKLTGEIYCRMYNELYGLNINALRFFTVYGPRGRPDMATYKFTRMIDKGEELTMFGDGTSKRDYTYVSDIADGIISALNKKLGFEVFNLGNSDPIQLKEFISIIEKNVGKKANIKQLPMQTGDVFITCADISKAKKILGYEPKTSIRQGIKKFVEWYKCR